MARASVLCNPLFYQNKKTDSVCRMRQQDRFDLKLMVEAAGVEPASENIPQWRLHAYPEL